MIQSIYYSHWSSWVPGWTITLLVVGLIAACAHLGSPKATSKGFKIQKFLQQLATTNHFFFWKRLFGILPDRTFSNQIEKIGRHHWHQPWKLQLKQKWAPRTHRPGPRVGCDVTSTWLASQHLKMDDQQAISHTMHGIFTDITGYTMSCLDNGY